MDDPYKGFFFSKLDSIHLALENDLHIRPCNSPEARQAVQQNKEVKVKALSDYLHVGMQVLSLDRK